MTGGEVALGPREGRRRIRREGKRATGRRGGGRGRMKEEGRRGGER